MGKRYVMTGPEVQETEVESEFLGHLGLVADMCDELGLVQFIDEDLGHATRITTKSPTENASKS